MTLRTGWRRTCSLMAATCRRTPGTTPTTDAPVVHGPAKPAPAPGWPFAAALEDPRASCLQQPHPHSTAETEARSGRAGGACGTQRGRQDHRRKSAASLPDQEPGRATVAEREAREYRQQDARTTAVAGQESHPFTASIRDKARLACPGASDRAAEPALRRARVWDWMSGLPDGLDTLVGGQGRELPRPAAGDRPGPGVDHSCAGAGAGRADRTSGSGHRQRADCRRVRGGWRTERAANHASDRGARARRRAGFAGTPGVPSSIRQVSPR